MPVSRATIIRGPCVITGGGQTFFTAGDARYVRSPKKLNVTVSGEVIERRTDYWDVALTFTPMCPFTQAYLDVLFPHNNPVRYASVFGGATDKPWICHGLDGRKLTIANGYVSKMPQLMLSAGKLPFGEITIRGIIANNAAPDDAGSIDAEGTETYSYPAPNPADFVTQNWTAAFGDADPWDALVLVDGLIVDFDFATIDDRSDDQGVMDVLYDNLTAFAKLTPKGITAAQLRAQQDIEVPRGSSFAGGAADLVLTGADGSVITLYQANVEDDASLEFGQKERVGELTFRNSRRIDTGVLGSIFDIVAAS